jgi:hypothetical protein
MVYRPTTTPGCPSAGNAARNREGAGRAHRQNANFKPPGYGELVKAQGGYQ